MQLERNLRATAFNDPSLAIALRKAARWIPKLERSSISDVTVVEDGDGDWWVTIYWSPAVEEQRGD